MINLAVFIKQIFFPRLIPPLLLFAFSESFNSRDVPVGVHHVDIRGGGHTGVSVAAGVGADVTVGNLEILRRKMIRRVAAQVDRVKAGWLVRRRLQARVVPALGTDGVRAAVGRG